MAEKAAAGLAIGITALALILLLQLKRKPTLPPDFEIATVGLVDRGRFSMAFPEYGKGLTYIEVEIVVIVNGKYQSGRVFIAPPEAYYLSWSQLRQNIIAGMYRELTPSELEAYWIS